MSSQKLVLKGFPTTVPALKIKCSLTGQLSCGSIHSSPNLANVNFGHGTVKSIPGFEPALDFTIKNGHDWFSVDIDQKHGRLDISAVVSDTQGRCFRVIANGVITLNEQVMGLLLGSPDAKSMPFGFAVEHFKFECGHEPYKALDSMLFAGSSRFVKDESGELFSEIYLSRIVAGSGYE